MSEVLTNSQIIEQLLKCDLSEYENLASLLTMAKEVLDEDRELSKATAKKVRNLAIKQISKNESFYGLYNAALLFLAQSHMDFDAYLLFTERNRDPEDQYYLPRRKKLYGLVKKMQKLLDDELDILSISMPPGTGKALSENSKVLTPTGWKRMGDIKIGDSVISGTGKETTVLGVYPQGKKPCYEVVFDDGSKAVCSDDHLWKVQTKDDRNKKRHGENGRYRVIELSEMIGHLRVKGDRRKNYSVDYVPKIEFREQELKIDPYLLGVILGDGGISGDGIVITLPDDEIRERISAILPDGYLLRHKSRYDWRVTSDGERNKLKKCLEEYGLTGHKSIEKFIPKDYLYASYEHRLELLRGLLDTDGCASDFGYIEYLSSSPRLATDVVELVHSLGGYASICKKKNTGYQNADGEFIKFHDTYRIIIQFSANQPNPFWLSRKRNAYNPKRDELKRFIAEINYVGDEECWCIYVDDPCHLYITDDYIITHNTTLGEFFISFVMGHYPNTPNLMSSHSGYMTRMFYDAVLNIVCSNEYCWSEVFPDVKFESNNAKEETINLDRWQPFKTLTCRSIRGSLTGVTRCEGFLYVDDLVSGIEEALSLDRLDKLYGEYTTDLKSRKKKKAKEIHIATRWSVHDVIGRLERRYENNPRAEFIAVPDIDPNTGESNFDYDYDVGFSVEYFKDMEMSMDDVSYRCLYKSAPIEREGILYHPSDLLRYLDGLPDTEPDSVLAVCDTKDTGTDSNALLVFYQYGDKYYLEDCVFSNIDPGTLDELNSDMLVKHHVHQCRFESNKEGSRTANEVERLVKEKGGKCHITKKYTTQNKITKIITRSSWVKEHVYFKDITEYDPKSDYGKMMAELCTYTQLGTNTHDDAPDALAMFADFVDSLLGGQAEVMKRSDLGF